MDKLYEYAMELEQSLFTPDAVLLVTSLSPFTQKPSSAATTWGRT